MSTFRNIMSDVNYGISNVSTVMTSCASAQPPVRQYPRRLEKVKFGVPLDQVCKKEMLPGPLLMILLKLNKEGPFKRDVFRAPGHQGNMRKLVHYLQQGRLVNIQNYSVNTIASVLKKFLRKIPGGIFGPDNEARLFQLVKLDDQQERREGVHAIVSSLPVYSQHLLVLLFGTFRVIASNSSQANTGMTAEALGVSVAPSFFHTCCSAGKTAGMEDVEKFKHATKVTSYFIENFGRLDLFGRSNYEYYARLTGRILKVEDEWIFFTYPLDLIGVKDDMDPSLNHSRVDSCPEKTGSLEMIPENCPLDPRARLSISLDDQGVASSNSRICSPDDRPATLGRHKQKSFKREVCGATGSDARSFSCLPQVHQRQTERMRARSDWFLSGDCSGLVTVRLRPEKGFSSRPSSMQNQEVLQASSERLKTLPGCSTFAKGSTSPYAYSSHGPLVTGVLSGRGSPSIGLTHPSRLSPQPLQYLQAHNQQKIVASVADTPESQTPPLKSQQALDGSPTCQQQSQPSCQTSQPYVSGKPPDGQATGPSLRRRLSDKDKERRLVRRSSSKRKDKENGTGAPGDQQSQAAGGQTNLSGSGSLSGDVNLVVMPATVAAAASGNLDGTSATAPSGNIASTATSAVLKRANSSDSSSGAADGRGAGTSAATGSVGQHAALLLHSHHHPAISRTASQDGYKSVIHNRASSFDHDTCGDGGGGTGPGLPQTPSLATVSQSLTRSLPRI